MTGWIIGVIVVLAVIVLAWIANAYRLAGKNKNVARQSPAVLTDRGADVDEANRSVDERARTERRPPPGV